MIAVYCVPTEVFNHPHMGQIRRPVAAKDIARSCTGFKRWWTHLPAGPLVPFTLLTVEADAFDPLNADARVLPLGAGGESLRAWLAGDTQVRAAAPRLVTRLEALGLGTGACTREELFFRIGRRLSPALHNRSYDPRPPFPPQTIMDDFETGTGGNPIGAGYEEIEGTSWQYSAGTGVGGSVSIRETGGAPTVRTMRRSEAAFPNNHYAQFECEFTGGAYSCPAIRVQSDGSCYFALIDQEGGDIDLYEHPAGSVGSILASAGQVTAVNTFYQVRVTGSGSDLSVDFEGGNLINTSDGTYTDGKPGGAAIQGNADFDAAEFSDASGGGPTKFILSRF